ncbi:MAG: hypothetical protein IJD40_11990 [Lachnospiraceae bacterium]|nr:hypothetical protein [Lachnospiraceae bacterium]
MSLKSILTGSSEGDKAIQDVIRKNLPKKEDFSTAYGQTPFSKYEVLAPYELSNSADAGIVGTAFDYLARAMIAQPLEKNKEDSLLGLKALIGIERIAKKINDKELNLLRNKYIDVLVDFIDYVYSNYALLPDNIIEKCRQEECQAWSKYVQKASFSSYEPNTDINKLISGAYYFAKLEQVYRTGGMLPENGISSLVNEPSKELIFDLSNICRVFKERFIEGGLVHPDSVVIFNPSFGIASYACGGADADVYVDGVLYDFKTSKKNGYSWQETAQLVMYYYLNEIASSMEEPDMPEAPAQLAEYKIFKLAFYKARFGEVEYFDTEYFDNEEAEGNFNEISDLLLKRLKKECIEI